MAINDPTGERRREHLRAQVEELIKDEEMIIAGLAEVFGSGNFGVDEEKNVSCSRSDLELGEEKAKKRIEAERRLKEIRAQINQVRKSDPDILREVTKERTH